MGLTPSLSRQGTPCPDLYSASPSFKTIVYGRDSSYEGQVNEKNARHGKGMMTYEDGSVYVGNWQHGLPHNFGVFLAPGIRYEGWWEAGQKQGKGYERTSKARFFGTYVEGVKDGDAISIRNGQVFYEKWTKGRLIKQRHVFDPKITAMRNQTAEEILQRSSCASATSWSQAEIVQVLSILGVPPEVHRRASRGTLQALADVKFILNAGVEDLPIARLASKCASEILASHYRQAMQQVTPQYVQEQLEKLGVPIAGKGEVILGKRLGKGAFGSVWLGRWGPAGRVAVKLFLNRSHGLRDMLMEARVLKRISSKRVNCLLGATVSPPALLLEWVEGCSLFERIHASNLGRKPNQNMLAMIKRQPTNDNNAARNNNNNNIYSNYHHNLNNNNVHAGGGNSAAAGAAAVNPSSSSTLASTIAPLSVREQVEIALGVSRAMEDLHEAGVLYCDLKSTNVLLRRPGSVTTANPAVTAAAAAALAAVQQEQKRVSNTEGAAVTKGNNATVTAAANTAAVAATAAKYAAATALRQKRSTPILTNAVVGVFDASSSSRVVEESLTAPTALPHQPSPGSVLPLVAFQEELKRKALQQRRKGRRKKKRKKKVLLLHCFFKREQQRHPFFPSSSQNTPRNYLPSTSRRTNNNNTYSSSNSKFFLPLTMNRSRYHYYYNTARYSRLGLGQQNSSAVDSNLNSGPDDQRKLSAEISSSPSSSSELIASDTVNHHDSSDDDEDEEEPIVKLCDLGLAAVAADDLNAPLHGAGVRLLGCVGTQQWMASEVIRGEGTSRASDVFSFGVLLWEIMSRRIPYQELTPLQVCARVGYLTPIPLIPVDAPGPLVRVMLACMASEPSERPSFVQLSSNLSALLRSCEGSVWNEMTRFVVGFGADSDMESESEDEGVDNEDYNDDMTDEDHSLMGTSFFMPDDSLEQPGVIISEGQFPLGSIAGGSDSSLGGCFCGRRNYRGGRIGEFLYHSGNGVCVDCGGGDMVQQRPYSDNAIISNGY